MSGHLRLLAEELANLYKYGHQTPREIQLRLPKKVCIWSFLDSDIPALKKMLDLASHASYSWCNRCPFIGNRVANVLRLLGYSEPQSQVTKSERETLKKRGHTASEEVSISSYRVFLGFRVV